MIEDHLPIPTYIEWQSIKKAMQLLKLIMIEALYTTKSKDFWYVYGAQTQISHWAEEVGKLALWEWKPDMVWQNISSVKHLAYFLIILAFSAQLSRVDGGKDGLTSQH